jgi:thiamine-monophosphate kinase
MRELALLDQIYRETAQPHDNVLVGPGDDMAVLLVGDQTLLVTVDQIADGVHFRSQACTLEQIARKLIVRNLSDVAAMAALPHSAVVTACLPHSWTQQQAEYLFSAVRQTAESFNCPLVGGDISIWDHPLLLTATITAVPDGVQPVTRSGAKPGDIVFVSGQIGGAWDQQGGGGHLDAQPRIGLARNLAEQLRTALHSMIDLSDGLGTDLQHICRASQVMAEVDIGGLPLRPTATDLGRQDGRPAYIHGLTDGEDYELCFTVESDRAADVPAAIDGVNLTRIGRITAPAPNPGGTLIQLRHPDGRSELLTESGWEHHR